MKLDVEVKLTEKGKEILRWMNYEDKEMLNTYLGEIMATVKVGNQKTNIRWQGKMK